MMIYTTASVQKLKKQVQLLHKKEEEARHKLRMALKKIQKLKRAYQLSKNQKTRAVEDKVAQARASVYAKVATDLEQHLQKSVTAKGRALTSAIAKVEKKHLTKLVKDITSKAKKIKAKKASKKKKNTTQPVSRKKKATHKRGKLES